MKVIYLDRPENPEDLALLQQASQLLEETISTTRTGLPTLMDLSNITATWSLQKKNGRPVYVLTISDSIEDVSEGFLPSELQELAQPPLIPSLLPYYMARLWGDLLEKRRHRLVEEMLKGRQE